MFMNYISIWSTVFVLFVHYSMCVILYKAMCIGNTTTYRVRMLDHESRARPEPRLPSSAEPTGTPAMRPWSALCIGANLL